MNKEIQPKSKIVRFECASCKTVFNIDSTYKNDVCHIDICSHCHPWYLGKTSAGTVRGKSEKLNSKFEAGKQFNEKKSEINKKISKNSNNKKISNFKDIKISE